ncbi:uncharacterized protein [Montipora capricornis]|uniref:uncharacterized protein n=1 Tax=Montipora capricornis TaxID=246305 RepID=UPI0035F13A39
MTPICVFIAILCIPHCSGRYFADRIFRPKPRMPLQDIAQSDAGCVDDKNYADGCRQQAAIANYCMHHETFMRKHCPLSCKFCSQETAKPPAPAVCDDDPAYADGCPAFAAVQNYCQDQETFAKKFCRKSCEFCSGGTKKAPAPIVCEDDPAYADGCPAFAAVENYCQDQETFTRTFCRKSCKFCTEGNAIMEAEKFLRDEVCDDDPAYADGCAEHAGIPNYCQDQKEFMRKNCPKSCGFCTAGIQSSPEASIIEPLAKPMAPPAFCRDRAVNCSRWKALGACQSSDINIALQMTVYCGVTCDICKAPTPEECYDKKMNCNELKSEGKCTSTDPLVEHDVKSNCLITCGFCNPDIP